MNALLIALTFSAAQPLKVWHGYRGGEESALIEAAQRFTQETGTPVELLPVPYQTLASKLTSAIPHDAGPDVFIFAHERLRQFQRLGIVDRSTGRLEPRTYLPQSIDALTLDGETYGYPLAFKCVALYVNKKRVPKPPATTDELEALLPALSNPKERRFGLAYESGEPYYHAPILLGFGGALFDAQGRTTMNTPGMAKSLAWVLKLQERGFMPQEVSGALVLSLFNEGRAAMVVSGPWLAADIHKDIDYQVVPLPTVSETGLPLKPFLGVEAAFVSGRAEQPDIAHRFAKFLSLGAATQLRVEKGQQIPAELAAYETEAVKSNPLIAAFRAAAANAMPMPTTLEMARWWEPMKLTVRGVVQRTVTPEAAGAMGDRLYRALNRQSPPPTSPTPWLITLGVVLLGLFAYAFVDSRRGLPWRQRYPDTWRAVVYMAPAAIGIAVLVLIPFTVGISLSLFHYDAGTYTFVGWGNFIDILGSHDYSITEPLSFYFTLGVTILWTALNVALHVGIGLALAILLKEPLLKLRGVYRVLLIIPWAVPNYITALMWKGMFHRQFGAINGILELLGIEPVSWFTRFSTAFAANLATNTWLGFPFMMVVSLGALQSIPKDLYEAAEVDGASRWTQFRRITLPMLKPALLPSIILGTVWTFNMFNVIYLVSGGEPGGSTNILVTEAFRWAFERNEQYGFAAAYAVLIFVVLFIWSAFTKRLTTEKA
ncbi:MAG: extracellular solute-binding protein [Myxococcaceae bacterium]|nr:extracellular solute-binding protein [Myxococcaceae bacterium]